MAASSSSSSTSIISVALAAIIIYCSSTNNNNHVVSSFPLIPTDFKIRQQSKTTKTSTTSTLFSVGNFIAGVTNSPPSTLLSSEPLKESLVAGTSLQNKQLAKIYKASKDGWSAIDFHNNVDEKGSCLVVALTRSGILFGGFNPVRTCI